MHLLQTVLTIVCSLIAIGFAVPALFGGILFIFIVGGGLLMDATWS